MYFAVVYQVGSTQAEFPILQPRFKGSINVLRTIVTANNLRFSAGRSYLFELSDSTLCWQRASTLLT
jgi:hypothetical protein